ncbi:MAG: hypothetical protein IT350_01000 [Deltaproteobacteria bacterium]|nr:hypothetical protein [Deltaproteobacteria bacterium]
MPSRPRVATIVGRVAAFAWLAVTCAAFLHLADGNPTHRARLEDRGQGDSFITAREGYVAGVGMHSGRAWVSNEGRPPRWIDLDRPAHGVAIAAGGLVAVIPYVDDRLWMLGPREKTVKPATVVMPGRTTIAAATFLSGAWYVAWYDRVHDRTRKKKFPWLIPAQMRYEFGVARLDGAVGARNRPNADLYRAKAIWHEETSHPWRLVPSPDGERLYVLAAVSEELIAIATADGAELFRVPTPPLPADLACVADACFVAAPGSSHIAAYDARTGAALPPVPAGRGVTGVDLAGDTLYAISKYERRLVAATRGAHRWTLRETRVAGVPSDLAIKGPKIVVADAADGTRRFFETSTLAPWADRPFKARSEP